MLGPAVPRCMRFAQLLRLLLAVRVTRGAVRRIETLVSEAEILHPLFDISVPFLLTDFVASSLLVRERDLGMLTDGQTLVLAQQGPPVPFELESSFTVDRARERGLQC